MDGVLSDFVGASEVLLGTELKSKWKNSVYTIPTIVGMSEVDFWNKVDDNSEKFWGEMPLCEDAGKLYRGCINLVGKDNVFVASRPSNNPESSKYKLIWLQKYFPSLAKRFFLCKQKYLLAAPGRVLIDDSDDEVQMWFNNGGSTILYPRPWNSGYHKVNEIGVPELLAMLDDLA